MGRQTARAGCPPEPVVAAGVRHKPVQLKYAIKKGDLSQRFTLKLIHLSHVVTINGQLIDGSDQ